MKAMDQSAIDIEGAKRMTRYTPQLEPVDPVSASAFATEDFQHEPARAPTDLAHFRRSPYLDFGECKVAVVPCTSRSKPSDTPEVYVLSLTWSQLMTRLGGKKVDVSAPAAQNDVVSFGEVQVNLLSLDTYRAGEPVVLTAMEIKVLKFFLTHPNEVITRDDLLNQVWGYDNYPCTRTVDTHVFRLRQKLESDITRPVHFRTVHRMGYKFVP
jgi:DNA-binding winged helix-turn-helix (wHTH) protein